MDHCPPISIPIASNSVDVEYSSKEDVVQRELLSKIGLNSSQILPEVIEKSNQTPSTKRTYVRFGKKKKSYRLQTKKRTIAMRLRRLNDAEFRKRENEGRRARYRREIEKSRESERVQDSAEVSLSNEDVCDCMSESCPGCHFTCKKCRSTKCGVRCRRTRHWDYTNKMTDENLQSCLSSKDVEENIIIQMNPLENF